MINVPTIARRELSAYFLSPIAYIVMTFFLLISGFFFAFVLWDSKVVSLRPVLGAINFILLIATPMLTMRLLAEEKRSGTLEALMTAPVTDADVVLGKFFAALGFYIVLLLPTLLYVLILEVLGKPDYLVTLAAYLGLLLSGCFFMSVGLLASSFTRNQIAAGVITLVTLLLFWMLGLLGNFVPGSVLGSFFSYVGTYEHMESFSKGLINVNDVVYYISFSVFFLFLTVKVVEMRKWR